jgi:predicted  nucleic acid-binding Zn-ribbon protein
MTGMESKRLMALDRGAVAVDLAKENRRLRIDNAYFRALVFYDEMLRDTIVDREKEINRLSEVVRKANSEIKKLQGNLKEMREKYEPKPKKSQQLDLLPPPEETVDVETP